MRRRGSPIVDIRNTAICACCNEPVYRARVATEITIMLEPVQFDGVHYNFARHRCHPPRKQRAVAA